MSDHPLIRKLKDPATQQRMLAAQDRSKVMSLRNQRSPKRDLNEKDLRHYMHGKGIDSWPVNIGDFPDLICCWQGLWFPVEIKNKAGKNKMSFGQQVFFDLCRTRNAPCYKISDEQDIDLMLVDLKTRQ